MIKIVMTKLSLILNIKEIINNKLQKVQGCPSSYSIPVEVQNEHDNSLLFYGKGGIPERVSLCSLGCSRTHSVHQAALELRHSSASASQVLGLTAFATIRIRQFFSFIKEGI